MVVFALRKCVADSRMMITDVACMVSILLLYSTSGWTPNEFGTGLTVGA